MGAGQDGLAGQIQPTGRQLMYVMYVILNFKTLGQVFKLVFFAVCAQSMCVFATSASSGKYITVGLKQRGLQQHSLMLSHDVNPTGPEDI